MIYWWLKGILLYRKCKGCYEPRPHSHHFSALGRWYYSRDFDA